MQIVKLPSILPGDLDLAQINQQLRDRAARLDWSAVVSADAEHLAVLLAELDISDDEDVLGSDSLSDTIGDRVIQVLEQAETQPSKMPQKKPKPSSVTPQVWKKEQSDLSTIIDIPEGASVAPLLEKPSHFQIRAELEEMIFKDLLGPAGGEEEEIDENNVSDRYLVGLLAPLIRNKKPEEPSEDRPELQDELATTDKGNPEEGSTEGTTPPSTTMFPSTMGMTFCVDGEAKAIEITAKWGRYEKKDSEYSFDEKGNPKKVWKRHPMKGIKIQLLETKKEFQWIVNPDEAPSVYIKGKIRRMDNQNWIVTLFLVNAQTEPSRSRDRTWLFQPELSVRSANANYPDIFVRKPLPSLQNLDLHHPDRTHPSDAICDLLWFPTGGGKTEAYLGLTAYAIALRRLQGKIGNRDGEKGIAVLMRYTLRLLTLQQFQRATTLICACESIRRENPQKWGNETIRIGLWVGQNSTPNYTSGSEEFIKQQKGGTGGISGSGSPHQLTNCPWCGTKIHSGKHTPRRENPFSSQTSSPRSDYSRRVTFN
jgi:hypothetical protein